MNYTTFRKAYNTLSDEYRFIIFNFLQKMEHAKDNPSDKIDYSHGLKIAMSEKELTINSLTFLIEEKTGYRDLRETIASMIERGSSSFAYFQDALDVLEIDENFLIQNSKYIQSRIDNIEWCFKSISKQNQEAIYHLVLNLANPEYITNFLECFQHRDDFSSTGVISGNEDIPFF